MSCPMELVLARAVERHVFGSAVRTYRCWMRNPLEKFKWQLVHELDLRRNRVTGEALASLTLRPDVRPLFSSSVVPPTAGRVHRPPLHDVSYSLRAA
jgi:hypothetical protein